MLRLSNLSIKSKLFGLLFLPVLALLYFAGLTLAERLTITQQMQKISNLAIVAQGMGDVIHELQKERGMTAGFLGSKGKNFAQDLPQQRQLTDQKRQLLDEQLKSFNFKNYDAFLLENNQKLQANLQQITQLRSKVDTLNAQLPEVLGFYTQTIGYGLSAIESMRHLTQDGDILIQFSAYISLLKAKEFSGIERAVLTNTFAADKFAPGIYNRFITLVASQEVFIQTYQSLATSVQQQALNQVLESDASKAVNEMRQKAHTHFYEGGFNTDASVWFKTITQKIDGLREVESQVSHDILNLTYQKTQAANAEFWVYAVALLILIILVILLSMKIMQGILTPVNHLMNLMKQVQATGNFSARMQIVQTDEIGQMSTAFNQLLDNTQQALQEANRVVGAIAKGEFTQRFSKHFNGELDALKQGVNASAESVDFTMQQLGNVMDALTQGDFSIQMSHQVPGAFRTQVQTALDSMKGVIDEINLTMEHMARGDFDVTVTTPANGDLLKLKDSVNKSVGAIGFAIKAISDVVLAQAQGNLTKEMAQGSLHGQLLNLKNAMNDSTLKVKEVVDMAAEASEVVSGAAAEVSKGSEDLSHRVQEQAAALEQTSATMEQMNAQVQSASDNAQHASQISQEVQLQAQQGAQVMQQTLQAMHGIQDASHKIVDIVALIDGIAFQTNLLALNAAVEAARAGEHGRGFAVVAGEVRNLAGKSADAAKDIKKLIDVTAQRVEQGAALAAQSGQVLQQINTSINSVTDMIADIAKTSAEQAQGIGQVHQAIMQIDVVTQHNAALVEETSAASESLSEQAEKLQTEISFFNTGRKANQVKMLTRKSPVKANDYQVQVKLPIKKLGQSTPVKLNNKAANTESEWDDF
ncbi:methyl-accepting chemotaxis protein [Thiomicrorhabdus aquaedulcis]|uniref:methyl-accepting chemotaxis protein n=1 Tax=Thiomicrorhabdus aquaedulcis TaxID=2211106 RepID=UPI000FD85529|nr:nitrate- and nitrite sensing domain-containing protein [Thiomicrorhabdus aquaedulcis]